MDKETKPASPSAEDLALAPVRAGTAWLSADELAARISADAGACTGRMARWAREGRLFALPGADQPLYPEYAFDAAGEPLPVVQRVLQNLSAHGGHDALHLACWFESTNAYLDGARPREMLVTDPERVVAAAEAHSHCRAQLAASPAGGPSKDAAAG